MPVEPVIKIDHVSKSYQLAKGKDQGGFLSGLFGREKSASQPSTVDDKTFWALKDVSLEIPKGSMVGVLGLNGAGKSTFLKLVSGALQPTQGSIRKLGDVALIELGAGFNPHLTARENIRLLGRQKGLSSSQIEEKISYVEEFADIGLFFDQPLNTYSSGMQSRVAFGNAFSIDPEILIVDEALSVGDASFSNKCFRRIEDLRARGKSILFASHDRYTVSRLCDLGMVLDHGELKYFGTAKDASLCYERIVEEVSKANAAQVNAEVGASGEPSVTESVGDSARPGQIDFSAFGVPGHIVEEFVKAPFDGAQVTRRPEYNSGTEKFGTGDATILDFLVWSGNSRSNPPVFEKSSSIVLLVKIKFEKDALYPVFGFEIENREGVLLYGANTILLGMETTPVYAGECHLFAMSIDLHFPGEQEYFISPAIADGLSLPTATILDKRSSMIRLQVRGENKSTGLCELPVSIHDSILLPGIPQADNDVRDISGVATSNDV